MALDNPDLAFPFEDEVDYEKQTITELKGLKHVQNSKDLNMRQK
jgi:hypothetical protein